MKLVTVSEMKSIEKQADASGLTYAMMMESAGAGLADVILELEFPEGEELQALALVGPGNNGGDALVALSHLAAQEWAVRAYLVNRKVKGDALLERLRQAGGEIVLASEDANFDNLVAFLETSHVLIDGVLGTGIRLPLKRDVASVLAAANEAIGDLDWPPYVVAVDCPSGVDCDSGAAAPETIPASTTVCMAAVKQGLLKLPAFEQVGELRVVDIGLPETMAAWAAVQHEVADASMVEEILPARPDDAHKGTFGTALIVAGSINFTGAALLAGKAAYRSGAGLVTMAVPAPLHGTLAGQFPEATWIILPHETGVIASSAADVLAKNLDRATAMLLGPGFGLEESTGDFIEALLKGRAATRKTSARIGFIQPVESSDAKKTDHLPPLVVDADGLKLLAKIEGWAGLLPPLSILTPHPGEMSVLTGLEKEEIQADRLAIAKKYASEWNQVVVLKGAFTIIAAPDGRATLIPVATSALARAGTGDVLAGLIIGLRAQGVDAYEAAIAGAWIHAQAGIAAADRVGNSASVMAGDVLEAVTDVLWGMV